MIECVTLETAHHFIGNPIAEQHRLRFESIIKRQSWDVPNIRQMEFDQYDNPAAYYFIQRDNSGKALGTARLYPTTLPYMLQEVFPELLANKAPQAEHIWEGSRIAIDKSLPKEERQSIMQRLVLAYLEFAIHNDIKSIIGVMYPVYWKNIFVKSGWNVNWLGEVKRSAEGHKIVAGDLQVSPSVLRHVRSITGIKEQVLDYGTASLQEVQRLYG